MEDKVKSSIKRKKRPVFAIMSIQDDNKQIIKLSKDNVILHKVESDAEAVLEGDASGSYPAGSFYVRIPLP
jgi:hypothetical protein